MNVSTTSGGEDRTLRDEALAFADAGSRVFPLRPGTKRPLTKHGHLDATTHRASIEWVWSAYPNANIGLPTGDGVVVIDIDPRHGGEVDPSWPTTLKAATPSGGFHLYYRAGCAVPCSVGRVAPGVDVRGEGGYVVAPPSATKDGRWSWLRDDALAEIPAELLAAALASPASEGGYGDGRGLRFAPREQVGEGGRNDYLARYAGWLHAAGNHPGEVSLLLARENATVCQPMLSDREVARINESIGKREAAKRAAIGGPS